MSKKAFFPITLEAQVLWCINMGENIEAYAAKYGITTTQVDAIKADAKWVAYWFGKHQETQTFAEGMSAFFHEACTGVKAGAEASVQPVPPDFTVDAPPTAVEPGVFGRLTGWGNMIKDNKTKYTIGDGEVLHLEGTEIIPPDLVNVQPVVKLFIIGGRVDVKSQEQGMQGKEVWVKRGAADWGMISFTTNLIYVDPHDFPAVEEKWEYKEIYHFGGARVGMWSDVVGIMVKAG